MKTNHKLFMTILALAACMPAFCARAQYHPTGEDGITASPRVRQMLSERPVFLRAAKSDRNTLSSAAGDGVAASPRVRARLEERKAVLAAAANPGPTVASTTRPPNDGIIASPKLREQLRERPAKPQIEIAPVK